MTSSVRSLIVLLALLFGSVTYIACGGGSSNVQDSGTNQDAAPDATNSGL